jgi:hypothetical protein
MVIQEQNASVIAFRGIAKTLPQSGRQCYRLAVNSFICAFFLLDRTRAY